MENENLAVGAQGTNTPATPIVKAKLPAILEAPVLGQYLDFRKFLGDFYAYRREISKRDIRPYNYAVFSAAANIKSPNYLKMIIEGKRNLSLDMVSKFAKALGLNKELSDEFELLVRYGQATDAAERNMNLKELNEKRVDGKLKSGEIDQKTWDKVPGSMAWIIYAMIDQQNVKFTASKVRELLRSKATVDEVESAIQSLIDAGQVVKDEATGELKKSRSLMESSEEIPVALVRKLQSELMYLGLESLFQDAATEREFGSATLALTKSEFEELRFTLRKIRKEAAKNIATNRTSTKGERVYQLNLQLFPVTDKSNV